MQQGLIQYLRKQGFQPDLVSLVINPFYLIRSALFNAIRKEAPHLKGKLLDFGCGRKPYQNLFKVDEYIGMDIQTSGHNHNNSLVDVYYDGKHIPFPDNYFDAVFCSEVIEHVFDPEIILPEILRVCKPGAKILLTVPFCWNEHEMPFDYARYSSVGMRHLLEKNGFRNLQLRKTGHFVTVNFQLWALYWFELFKSWGRFGHAVSMILIFPINVIAFLVGPLFPRNQTLYFNNVVIAEK